jgi:RNA polymerase sigma-70 factor, ECF subfamily
MGNAMRGDSSDVEDLVRHAASGNSESWAELMKRYRERLRRMVSFRLDPRLQGRLDASDVVQDVCLAAWQHLDS